jgi:hypothetical protein
LAGARRRQDVSLGNAISLLDAYAVAISPDQVAESNAAEGGWIGRKLIAVGFDLHLPSPSLSVLENAECLGDVRQSGAA